MATKLEHACVVKILEKLIVISHGKSLHRVPQNWEKNSFMIKQVSEGTIFFLNIHEHQGTHQIDLWAWN